MHFFFIPLFLFLWCPAIADIGVGTDTTDPVHISVGAFQVQKISYGLNTTPIWENTNPPAITAFSVAPDTIDLDTRSTGNITFTLSITGDRSTTITPTARSITFTQRGADFFADVSAISQLYELEGDYFNGTSGFRYQPTFTRAFLKQKTPLNIQIDILQAFLQNRPGGVYGLTYQSTSANGDRFVTNNIRTIDRVSSSSLTKAINFSLVDNGILTGRDDPHTPNSRFTFPISERTPFPFEYKYGGTSYSIVSGSNRQNIPYWFVCFYSSFTKTVTHFVINARAYRAFSATDSANNKCYWSERITPQNSDTTLRPSTTNLEFGINLKFSDGTYLYNTRSYLFNTTTSSGATTNAHIVRLPDGATIGATYTGANGANISTTVPNIPQPQKTTTYRLVASNSGGASHQDATVTVTKNPTLASCRRTNYIPARPGISSPQYTFGALLTGLPRPVVTYRFSGGQTGTIPTGHFRQGANTYTWNIQDWRITFATDANQSLTLTATNSSGTATCTIANINN